MGVVPLRYPAGEAIENTTSRLLIRQKLQQGELPTNGFLGRTSNGEECNGCDRIITDPLVVKGIATTDGIRTPIQMHVECFDSWTEERREFPP